MTRHATFLTALLALGSAAAGCGTTPPAVEGATDAWHIRVSGAT